MQKTLHLEANDYDYKGKISNKPFKEKIVSYLKQFKWATAAIYITLLALITKKKFIQ